MLGLNSDNSERLGYSILMGQYMERTGDATWVGDGGQPEVRVLQAAFCVVPTAAARAVMGPMRGADEVHT